MSYCMEEYIDDNGMPRVEWTDEEDEEIRSEAEAAREELLRLVDDTSNETGVFEWTTDARQFTIAEFAFEGDEWGYMVYWDVADGYGFSIFNSNEGTVCDVSSVEGLANYINNELL